MKNILLEEAFFVFFLHPCFFLNFINKKHIVDIEIDKKINIKFKSLINNLIPNITEN